MSNIWDSDDDDEKYSYREQRIEYLDNPWIAPSGADGLGTLPSKAKKPVSLPPRGSSLPTPPPSSPPLPTNNPWAADGAGGPGGTGQEGGSARGAAVRRSTTSGVPNSKGESTYGNAVPSVAGSTIWGASGSSSSSSNSKPSPGRPKRTNSFGFSGWSSSIKNRLGGGGDQVHPSPPTTTTNSSHTSSPVSSPTLSPKLTSNGHIAKGPGTRKGQANGNGNGSVFSDLATLVDVSASSPPAGDPPVWGGTTSPSGQVDLSSSTSSLDDVDPETRELIRKAQSLQESLRATIVDVYKKRSEHNHQQSENEVLRQYVSNLMSQTKKMGKDIGH
ncbi:hypothetical protein HDV00_008368 [Rhizophlyctis rosea]|nr:hypothetical protein HDV00_008368 [Rhizophlyctis rosea]